MTPQRQWHLTPRGWFVVHLLVVFAYLAAVSLGIGLVNEGVI